MFWNRSAREARRQKVLDELLDLDPQARRRRLQEAVAAGDVREVEVEQALNLVGRLDALRVMAIPGAHDRAGASPAESAADPADPAAGVVSDARLSNRGRGRNGSKAYPKRERRSTSVLAERAGAPGGAAPAKGRPKMKVGTVRKAGRGGGSPRRRRLRMAAAASAAAAQLRSGSSIPIAIPIDTDREFEANTPVLVVAGVTSGSDDAQTRPDISWLRP